MTNFETAPFRSTIQSIDDLRSSAGKLEAILNSGKEGARYAAIVCHPHPLGGGTMHNKVVYHATKVFSEFGLPVLRFNFRGVGLSEGAFDHGRGELDDAKAALDWMAKKTGLPVLQAGFSFGSFIGMQAACEDARVKGMIGLGVPYRAEGRSYSYEFLQRCVIPKLFVSGTEDQFGPMQVVAPMLEAAADPKKIVWIEGAEHFFQGTPSSPGPKLSLMQAAVRLWLSETLGLTTD